MLASCTSARAIRASTCFGARAAMKHPLVTLMHPSAVRFLTSGYDLDTTLFEMAVRRATILRSTGRRPPRSRRPLSRRRAAALVAVDSDCHRAELLDTNGARRDDGASRLESNPFCREHLADR